MPWAALGLWCQPHIFVDKLSLTRQIVEHQAACCAFLNSFFIPFLGWVELGTQVSLLKSMPQWDLNTRLYWIQKMESNGKLSSNFRAQLEALTIARKMLLTEKDTEKYRLKVSCMNAEVSCVNAEEQNGSTSRPKTVRNPKGICLIIVPGNERLTHWQRYRHNLW